MFALILKNTGKYNSTIIAEKFIHYLSGDFCITKVILVKLRAKDILAQKKNQVELSIYLI